ncbi:MAG: hypothetical protein QXU98_13700, partial [Candidatus Parvarchaeota archaeon]
RQDFGIRDETKIKKFLMDPSQTSQEFQLRYPAGGSLLIITFDKDLNIVEWLKEWFANKDKFFNKKDTYFFTILRTPPAIYSGYLTLSNGVGEWDFDLHNPYAMVGSEPMEEIIIFVKVQGQYKIALPKVEKIFDFDPSKSLINEKSEKDIIKKINEKIDLENDKHLECFNSQNLNISSIGIPSYIFTLPTNELVINGEQFKGTIAIEPQYGAIDFLGFLVMDFSKLNLSLNDIYFTDGENEKNNFLGRPIYLFKFKDIKKLMEGNNVEIIKASFGVLSGNNIISMINETNETNNSPHINKPLMTPALRALLENLISSNKNSYDPSEGEVAYLILNNGDILSLYNETYEKRPFRISSKNENTPVESKNTPNYDMFKILYRRFYYNRNDVNEYLQVRDILGGVYNPFIKGVEKTIEYALEHWRTNNLPYFVDHNQGHSSDMIILLLNIISLFPEQFRMEDLYILINAVFAHDVAMYSYEQPKPSENLRKNHALKSARLFLESLGRDYIKKYENGDDLDATFDYIYQLSVGDLSKQEPKGETEEAKKENEIRGKVEKVKTEEEIENEIRKKTEEIENRFRLERIALIILFHSTSWVDDFNTYEIMKLYELSFEIVHKLRRLIITKIVDEYKDKPDLLEKLGLVEAEEKSNNQEKDPKILFKDFKDNLQKLLNGENVNSKVDKVVKVDVYRDIMLTELFRLVDAMDVQQNRFGFKENKDDKNDKKDDKNDDYENYIRWKMMFINGINAKSPDEKMQMVEESLLHNYAHMSNKSVQFEEKESELNIVIEDNPEFEGLSQLKMQPEMKDKIRSKAVGYLIYPEVIIFNELIEEINKKLDDKNGIKLPKIRKIKIKKLPEKEPEEIEEELHLKRLNFEKASLIGEMEEYFSNLSEYIMKSI